MLDPLGAERHRQFYPHLKKVSTPEGIEFSDKVFIYPSLSALGYPQGIIDRIKFEPQLAVGEWVNKDQIITKVKFRVFVEGFPPLKYKKYRLKKPYQYIEREFRSPCSGLILSYEPQARWYPDGEARPAILIPVDEPKLSNVVIQDLKNLDDSLTRRAQQLCDDLKQGIISAFVPNGYPEDQTLHERVSWLEARNDQTTDWNRLSDQSKLLQSLKDCDGPGRFVDEMRSNDSKLRGLLRHLDTLAI